MRTRTVLAVALLPFVLAGCGTRVSDETLIEAGSLPVGLAPVAASSPDAGPPADQAPGERVAAASVPPVISGPAASIAPVTPGKVASPGKADATSAPAPGVVTADAPCARSLAPITLGQIGSFSGFLEPTLGGYRPGLAVWAAEVNTRGGVQCHPIRLVQRDDGSDPARTTSAAKDLIENQKVVAMVGADVPITIAAYRAAFTPSGIPTLGGDLINPDWNTDPLLFPNGPMSLIGNAGAIRSAIEAGGLTKVGLIHCVEASVCGLIRDTFEKMVAAAGGTVVSKQSASLTQTDYTSQCQSAKNAGVQVMFVALDSSSVQRFFRSCASIGFRPPSATSAISVGPATAGDANIQAATVYLSSPNPPYMTAALPGAKAFQDAMKRFAPGTRVDQSAMGGYSSGKLLEAALATVAAQARGGPVTTEMILAGLHSLRNETMGGLSAVPLTFAPGPHATGNCYFVTMIDRRGATDLGKGKPLCLSKGLPGF